MSAILGSLKDYEAWIYVILGVIAAWQIWKFIQAWDELRGAAFGLEREKAQGRLNSATIWVALCIFLGIGLFYTVTFIVPLVPEASPLPTPTLNLQATLDLGTITAPISTTQTVPTPLPTFGAPIESSNCISDTIMITSPENGSQVQGLITIEGSANIPDFGFYKYEVARPGDVVWLSINAGRERVVNGELGDWDTRSLPPDEYLLRLVVIDNVGDALDPCIIRVRVLPPDE